MTAPTIYECAHCQHIGDTPVWAERHERQNVGHLVIAKVTLP